MKLFRLLLALPVLGLVVSLAYVAQATESAGACAGFSSELPPNRLLKRSPSDCAAAGVAATLTAMATMAAAHIARPITGLSPMDVPCFNVSPVPGL